MEQVIYLSFVTASLSFTVTETKLFLPLRKWIAGKSALFGELFSCAYCFGYWIAFGLVALYRPRIIVSSWEVLDYLLTALIIAWLSGFQWVILCWLMEKTGK